jgi:segregation and condensation protein A
MYRIALSEFEGPLDLLLFFIKRDELDIYDIPISRITRNFLDYLTALQQLDLEVASDFIYMASLLMSIKAKMLLPRPELLEGELDEFDPRAELVQKLLEYKRFKEMSLHMQFLEEDRRQVFPRLTFDPIDAAEIEDETKKFTLFDLIQAYRYALTNMPKKTVHEIKLISVTIEDQTAFILKKLDDQIQVSFLETVTHFTERIEIVVMFLAILELAKNHLINIIIRDDYLDFWMVKSES